jgi:hypothetical protein
MRDCEVAAQISTHEERKLFSIPANRIKHSCLRLPSEAQRMIFERTGRAIIGQYGLFLKDDSLLLVQIKKNTSTSNQMLIGKYVCAEYVI